MCVYVYVYIYIYIHIYVYMYSHSGTTCSARASARAFSRSEVKLSYMDLRMPCAAGVSNAVCQVTSLLSPSDKYDV